MTRSDRRLLVDTSILGITITFLVTFLDFGGLLSVPERFGFAAYLKTRGFDLA